MNTWAFSRSLSRRRCCLASSTRSRSTALGGRIDESWPDCWSTDGLPLSSEPLEVSAARPLDVGLADFDLPLPLLLRLDWPEALKKKKSTLKKLLFQFSVHLFYLLSFDLAICINFKKNLINYYFILLSKQCRIENWRIEKKIHIFKTIISI